MTARFSSETVETKNRYHNIFQIFKIELQPRIIYPVEYLLGIKGHRDILTLMRSHKICHFFYKSMYKRVNFLVSSLNHQRRNLGTSGTRKIHNWQIMHK